MALVETYKILCGQCRRYLYVYKGDFSGPLRSRAFRPFPGVPVPAEKEPMMCPFCRQAWYLLNARTGGMMVMTDKGIRPHEPTGDRNHGPIGNLLMSPETPEEFKGANPDFTDGPKTKKEKPNAGSGNIRG